MCIGKFETCCGSACGKDETREKRKEVCHSSCHRLNVLSYKLCMCADRYILVAGLYEFSCACIMRPFTKAQSMMPEMESSSKGQLSLITQLHVTWGWNRMRAGRLSVSELLFVNICEEKKLISC